MSKKINLWGEISLLENQIQSIDIFSFQHSTDAEFKIAEGKHNRRIIFTIVIGVIGGLAFQSWEIGLGSWFGAIVIFGLFLLVRDIIFGKKKHGNTRYQVLVKANIAGSLKNYESSESWCSEYDAENAMRKIMLQMESDALREKSHLKF